MTRIARHIAVASLAALAAVAALLAADLTPPASAQSEDETTGRIVARRLANGRVEFGWQTPSGERVLPQSRYFPAPADATVDRWLRSSPVEVGGVAIGRINARLRADGRIEFAFTPTNGERILPQSRNFPADARVGRWLRSTEITIAAPAPRYIAVSAGGLHTCAIRTNGAIECWGWNGYGQSTAPAGSFTAVSAGSRHTCGLRESGAIECWGSNDSLYVGNVGLSNPPAGRYTTISAGFDLNCAIRDTGEVKCWGNNEVGQLDAPSDRYSAVSAGNQNACGLLTSGKIQCWGNRLDNQPYGPVGRFTAVSTGPFSHSCGLRESGEIECWGNNEVGQLDAPSDRYTAVSAGSSHTCGLRESGAIECWGGNTSPRWNPTTEEVERFYAGQTNALPGSYSAVSAGSYHTCAIRTTGEIACWGGNTRGQSDVPTD